MNSSVVSRIASRLSRSALSPNLASKCVTLPQRLRYPKFTRNQPSSFRCLHQIPRPTTLPKSSAGQDPHSKSSETATSTSTRHSRASSSPSTDAFSQSSTSADTSGAPASESPRPEAKDPAYYQISFTCVPCSHRSHHNLSKQGYHKGSILITCPQCRNRHVISDHLNIFGDKSMTIEQLMAERGTLVKRGSLGEDGNIELWPESSYDDASLEGLKKVGE